MAIIKKRRLSAYRFLKHYRLKSSDRGKILTFDIANLPKDVSIDELLEKYKKNEYNGRHNLQWIDTK